jgi:hypothetical protein
MADVPHPNGCARAVHGRSLPRPGAGGAWPEPHPLAVPKHSVGCNGLRLIALALWKYLLLTQLDNFTNFGWCMRSMRASTSYPSMRCTSTSPSNILTPESASHLPLCPPNTRQDDEAPGQALDNKVAHTASVHLVVPSERANTAGPFCGSPFQGARSCPRRACLALANRRRRSRQSARRSGGLRRLSLQSALLGRSSGRQTSVAQLYRCVSRCPTHPAVLLTFGQ